MAARGTTALKEFGKNHRGLAVVLLLATCLRVVLALRGGQFYFPDERRYGRSCMVLSYLASGNVVGVFDYCLKKADHTGWVLVGTPAAAIQYVVMRLEHLPTDRPSLLATAWVPGTLVSLASVACIGLVYAVALRRGPARARPWRLRS